MVQNSFIAEVQKLREMAKTSEQLSAAITRQCELLSRCNQPSPQSQPSQLRTFVTDLSDDELRILLFPPNKYVPLVRFLHTSVGKINFPLDTKFTWLEYAVALSELAGWTIDEQFLRKEARRQHTGE